MYSDYEKDACLDPNVFGIVGTKSTSHSFELRATRRVRRQSNGGCRGSVRDANQLCFEHIQEGFWDCGDLNHYTGNPACHSPTAAQAGGRRPHCFFPRGKGGRLANMR